MLQIDRKTIYAYVYRGLIPHVRIESNVRFPKHQLMRSLEERTFHPRACKKRSQATMITCGGTEAALPGRKLWFEQSDPEVERSSS